MAIINFGGVKENVVMRKEFSMAKARKILKNETIAVIGYGVQGPAQALRSVKKIHKRLEPGNKRRF